MKEIVYILINDYMPGLIKIGRTSTSVEQRMRDLYTTSVPAPFTCVYAATVDDAKKVEEKIHFAFGDSRVPSNREFFRIDHNRVRAILELLAIEEVTPVIEPQSTEELNEFMIRRPSFRFSFAKVPVGAILQFARDEAITCKVLSDKSIEFNGIETSLSAAAAEVLKNRGWKASQVQGPMFWLYDGESLEERRQRIELEA